MSINDNSLINLVDLSKFKLPPTVAKTKWNLNKILLVGFAIFSIFFLYNCRYGIFRQNYS
jgi:hypothetical protein